MKAFNSLEELQERSIEIHRGTIEILGGTTIAVGPESDREENIFRVELLHFEGYFALKNLVVSYVSGNRFFVTPYIRGIIKFLTDHHFKLKNNNSNVPLYVPFSNGSYPKDEKEKEKWQWLCKEAQKDIRDAFEEDCIVWCDKHNNGTILTKCFEIPSDGIEVSHSGEG